MCYFNHSCNPNLGISGNVIIVAMRDIKAGEELCLDYAILFSDERIFKCQCRSENCRRVITGEDWMRPDLQEKYRHYFSSYLLEKIEKSTKTTYTPHGV